MDFGDDADFDALGDKFGEAIMNALNNIDFNDAEIEAMLANGELEYIDETEGEKTGGLLKTEPLSIPSLPIIDNSTSSTTEPLIIIKKEDEINEKSSEVYVIEKLLKVKEEMEIQIQITHLKDSYLVYIGLNGKAASMDTLVTAIETKFSSMPSSTSILPTSSSNDEIAHKYAVMLSKRTKKVLYVSYNLPLIESEVEILLQKNLIEMFSKEN